MIAKTRLPFEKPISVGLMIDARPHMSPVFAEAGINLYKFDYRTGYGIRQAYSRAATAVKHSLLAILFLCSYLIARWNSSRKKLQCARCLVCHPEKGTTAVKAMSKMFRCISELAITFSKTKRTVIFAQTERCDYGVV